MNEVFLRSGATLPSSDKFDDSNTPFMPAQPVRAAPFVREPSDISPLGNYGLNTSNIRFEIPKTNGDNVSRISIRANWAALAAPLTGTYLRYCDYLGIAMIKEIRVKYGTSTLQTIHKEDLFIYLNNFLSDEEQRRDEFLVKGNMNTDQRNYFYKVAAQTKTPLYTLFFQDDLSKALHIQGLSQKLTIELDTEPLESLLQTDGTYTAITSPLTALNLCVEYNHVLMDERQVGISKYIHPKGLRYLFHDVQTCPPLTISSSQSLTTSSDITLNLQNLSMPTNFLAIMFRWTGDLSRTVSAAAGPSDAYGQKGRDWFNVSGWTAPLATPIADTAGPPVPLISQVAIKSGNNYLCKPTPVEDIIWEWRGRWFKGSPGLALLLIPYSHVPTASNAAMGSIDFSVVDQPQLILSLNASPNGYTTVGAYAAADIGDSSSSLRVDVFGFVYNNVDAINHDLLRPF